MVEIIHKLNLILQALLVNPIMAEYDQDGWHIRKYANGRADCKKVIDDTVQLTGMWGSTLVASSSILSQALPITLTDADCQITARGSSGNVWVTEQYVEGSFIKYKISSFAQSLTDLTVRATIRVTGRWK